MKRLAVLAAAAVVVATHAWTHVSISRNRAEARGGRVELTERELRLPRESGESTALFLELEWVAAAGARDRRDTAPWLNPAKLNELGFDCRVPVTQPDARDFYRAQMTALVFLVLELQSQGGEATPPNQEMRTRLVAVDAGRDPDRLREKFPDTTRHMITRGLVRLVFRDRAERTGEPLAQPRVEGRIAAVLPGQIFVAPPHNKVLAGLLGRDRAERDPPGGEPRYAVTVSWGEDYQPWISGLRLLPQTNRQPTAR